MFPQENWFKFGLDVKINYLFKNNCNISGATRLIICETNLQIVFNYKINEVFVSQSKMKMG